MGYGVAYSSTCLCFVNFLGKVLFKTSWIGKSCGLLVGAAPRIVIVYSISLTNRDFCVEPLGCTMLYDLSFFLLCYCLSFVFFDLISTIAFNSDGC